MDARVAVFGQISTYDATEVPSGPRKLGTLIRTRATVEGFLVGDFSERFQNATQQLGSWVQSGDVQYREIVTERLENAPDAFLSLFEGEKALKTILATEPGDTIIDVARKIDVNRETIRQYTKGLELFDTWLSDEELSPNEVTTRNLQRYLSWLKTEKEYAPENHPRLLCPRQTLPCRSGGKEWRTKP